MKKRGIALFLLLALLGLPGAARVATVEARSSAAIDPALAATLSRSAPAQMVSVLVILRDQENVRAVGGRNRRDRKRRVVKALRRKADATQTSLRALLQERRAAGRVSPPMSPSRRHRSPTRPAPPVRRLRTWTRPMRPRSGAWAFAGRGSSSPTWTRVSIIRTPI
jgi:hypothetical protein